MLVLEGFKCANTFTSNVKLWTSIVCLWYFEHNWSGGPFWSPKIHFKNLCCAFFKKFFCYRAETLQSHYCNQDVNLQTFIYFGSGFSDLSVVLRKKRNVGLSVLPSHFSSVMFCRKPSRLISVNKVFILLFFSSDYGTHY